ncbi:hypothetical protein DRN58_08410 [Thermococci archaeon]|nr:MAG: hypothetical protein DRN58_08410 [Thermococci archaeon]
MEDLIYSKPVSPLRIFLSKFSTGVVIVLFAGGIMFLYTLINEVYYHTSYSITIYIRDYIVDFAPLMIFCVSFVFFVAVLSRSTKITYIIHFIFVWFFMMVFKDENPHIGKFFNVYEFNAKLNITFTEHLELRAILLLISIAMLISGYFLYKKYLISNRSGF